MKLIAMLLLVGCWRLYASNEAVVLAYHHVAEDTPASTSVTPAAFRAHLDYLSAHDFSVRPLVEILQGLADGKALAEPTVAITFDDAYRSILTTAHPMLADGATITRRRSGRGRAAMAPPQPCTTE